MDIIYIYTFRNTSTMNWEKELLTISVAIDDVFSLKLALSEDGSSGNTKS